MMRWPIAAAAVLLLAACGSGAAEPEPTPERSVTPTLTATTSDTPVSTATDVPGSATPTDADPSATPVASTPDPEATVELTGPMVDTHVTVAVYADTDTPPAGTACVDLIQVIVPAHAADDVEWKPVSCIFEDRTWNRIQFKERGNTWFVHTIMILFTLKTEPPRFPSPATCRDWSELLVDARNPPDEVSWIGNCEITPPARGLSPPTRQVWARFPTPMVGDPDPDAPCWHLAPTYGGSGEGFTRDVLCLSYD